MDWRMEPDTRLAGGDSHPNYNFIASRARGWGDGGGGGGGGRGRAETSGFGFEMIDLSIDKFFNFLLILQHIVRD